MYWLCNTALLLFAPLLSDSLLVAWLHSIWGSGWNSKSWQNAIGSVLNARLSCWFFSWTLSENRYLGILDQWILHYAYSMASCYSNCWYLPASVHTAPQTTLHLQWSSKCQPKLMLPMHYVSHIPTEHRTYMGQMYVGCQVVVWLTGIHMCYMWQGKTKLRFSATITGAS